MFRPTTGRGRFSLLLVLALALLLAACPSPNAPDPALDIDDEQVDDPVDDGAAEEDGEDDGAAEDDAAEEEQAAATYSYSFLTCHDFNTAGGNSDGVLFGSVPGGEAGQEVVVTFTYQDGSEQTASGTIDESMGVTIVFPLFSIGETITVSSVMIDGAPAEIGGETSLVVTEESDCSTHPDGR